MDKQQEIIRILKAALEEIASMEIPHFKYVDLDGGWDWADCFSCEERVDIAQEALNKVKELE